MLQSGAKWGTVTTLPRGPEWRGSSHSATSVPKPSLPSGTCALSFRGHYEHSLDAKNRLSIPARFRAAFSSGVVLAKDPETCVAVWTPDSHEAIIDRALAGLNPMGSEYRKLSRFYQGNSFEVELDSSGRVTLPPPLLGTRRSRRRSSSLAWAITSRSGASSAGSASSRTSTPRSGR